MHVGDQRAHHAIDLILGRHLFLQRQLLVFLGQLDLFQQGHDMRHGGAVLRQSLGGLALDRDTAHIQREQVRQALPHLAGDGHDLGPVHDQHAVDVDDLVPGQRDLFHRCLQKQRRFGTLPSFVGRWEKCADVPGTDRSQQGVRHGVQQKVAVGVAGQPLGMVDLQTTDHKGNAGMKGV